MAETNCDFTAMVDFGDGLVKVRCTVTGDHDEHGIHVILGKGPRDAPMRHNVFDPED